MANPTYQIPMPPELNAPLQAECDRKGTTVQRIVREMLARRYRVKLTTPMQRGRPRTRKEGQK